MRALPHLLHSLWGLNLGGFGVGFIYLRRKKLLMMLFCWQEVYSSFCMKGSGVRSVAAKSGLVGSYYKGGVMTSLFQLNTSP